MINFEPYRVKIYYKLKTNIGFMNHGNYIRLNATENSNDRLIVVFKEQFSPRATYHRQLPMGTIKMLDFV